MSEPSKKNKTRRNMETMWMTTGYVDYGEYVYVIEFKPDLNDNELELNPNYTNKP